MFKKVLVPLDGTKQAEAILYYASQLAKGLNMPMVVLSVLSPHTVDMPAPLTSLYEGSPRESISGRVSLKTSDPSAPAENGSDEQSLTVEKYLNGIVERLSDDGIKAHSVIAYGRPAEEIVEIAEREGCNLIALSTFSDPSGHGILGSVTVKVLQASHIPILLLSPQKAAEYAEQGLNAPQIVVPVDGSPFGETALPYAEDLAQKLGLSMMLVRAVGPVNPAYLGDPAMEMVPVAGLADALDEEADDYLKQLSETLTAEGLNIDTQLLKGTPAKSIVEFTQSLPQSMIVMTTHGRSALARWLLGSVTEAVTRTAQDAVFIIPRQYGKRHATAITDMLAQTPIFSNLSEEDLQSIARSARIRPYHAGDFIVREGDETGSFFIIASGNVEVLKGTSVVDTMGAGDFFGEMSILDEEPRSASIRSTEATECVTIRRSDFALELQRRPEIAVRMLPEIVKRLREARDNPVV